MISATIAMINVDANPMPTPRSVETRIERKSANIAFQLNLEMKVLASTQARMGQSTSVMPRQANPVFTAALASIKPLSRTIPPNPNKMTATRTRRAVTTEEMMEAVLIDM